MYNLFFRRILFLFPPEIVHHFIIFLLKFPFLSKILKLIYQFDHPSLSRTFFDITFKNPIGLAAGFDKNAEIYSQLTDLGFGFIEIGTVTPQPQSGNPKPRIFRLPVDNALINRMGFNNDGSDQIVSRLKIRKNNLVIAGNIGKNRTTDIEDAVHDYIKCLENLYEYVNFFVINVSSPNTPHLRELQNKNQLQVLLTHVMEWIDDKPLKKPILLKIAPDLTNEELKDIVETIKELKIDGVVATNTTIGRKGLNTPTEILQKIGEGGLSGKPLARRSTEIIQLLRKSLGNEFPIIGVGGIHSVDDAIEKLHAGASLIELYTGFIYEGPGLLKKIKKALLKLE